MQLNSRVVHLCDINERQALMEPAAILLTSAEIGGDLILDHAIVDDCIISEDGLYFRFAQADIL